MSITRHHPGKILSAAVEHGNTVYLAGTVAEDPSKSVKHQTANILKQIDKLLAKADSHKSRILSATIWLTDMRHREKMNEAWLDWLDPANPPARACVEAKLADPLMLVEIAVIAAKKPSKDGKGKKAAEPAKAAKPAAKPIAKAAAKPIAKATPKPAPKAAPKKRDDLKVIEGIGPQIAQILNAAGISTYEALAAAQASNVKKLLDKAGPRFAMANPGTWAEQSKLLARGDMAGFQKLADRLKGGVRK
jgi:enamine deaminase RidA (YjgF/YER057c/UK114 family)